MERKDAGLAFLLQYENVAWYEKGRVRILDRRIYPQKITYVECSSWQEVRQAIADMVTQSAGPYTAAAMGMALAAYQVRDEGAEKQRYFLKEAAQGLAHARPTTANRMGQITMGSLVVAENALNAGLDVVNALFNAAITSLNRRYGIMEKVGNYLAALFPQGGGILTQCFGETIVGMMLKAARARNNPVRIICAETRPFLQGARLTASCAALLADWFNIPYYVTGIPDADKKSAADICIEQRNPEETLSCHGVRHTHSAVKGIYPSFDITPPQLISGVVTDKGIYRAQELGAYFDTPQDRFY